MKDIKGCFSHKSDDWSTPSQLYLALMDQGYIDPCPLNAQFDGLLQDYNAKKIFINPPFSKLSIWVDYAIRQAKRGNNVLLLMPARTDTKYFHRLLGFGCVIYFIKGRLHFNDSERCAPFPTILVELNGFTNWWYGGTLEEIMSMLNLYENDCILG